MRNWFAGPGAAPSQLVTIGTRSTDSTSPVTTVTLPGLVASRSAARSRSTSIASSFPACAASGRVMAPRPGPISRIASSGVAATAATNLLTQAGSRKCWANRLRGLIRLRLAAPISFLNLHDLFFAHAEVVTELMNQRFADRDDNLAFVVVAIFFNRVLEQRDAVGQLVAIAPAAIVHRRALIETK